ncbi:MAG: DUF5908 family protein [Candidatus Methylumidiphilus sp.]
MPIQINELVIRATVESDAKEVRREPPKSDLSREDLLAECVEQVLEILRQREDR